MSHGVMEDSFCHILRHQKTASTRILGEAAIHHTHKQNNTPESWILQLWKSVPLKLPVAQT